MEPQHSNGFSEPREQDLGVLRTAKFAMEQDLIGEAEYNSIKTAFTKAQMIKAGMDAGFMREEDYMQARDSFLQSLDFRVHQPVVVAAHPIPAMPAAVKGQPGPPSPGNHIRPGIRAGGHPPPPPGPPPASTFAHAGPAAAVAAGLRPQTSAPPPPVGVGLNNGPLAEGAVPIPLDLPRLGKLNAADGKKSMSGIALTEICINLFNHIKSKSAYKWVTFKIDDNGNQVVPEQLGAPTSTFENFVGALPADLCRYGVYDYAYHNHDTQQTINKLVFVHWAPEGSTIKSKMMYASTKDFFKSYLDGVGAELAATEPSELNEDELRDRVHQAMTRK